MKTFSGHPNHRLPTVAGFSNPPNLFDMVDIPEFKQGLTEGIIPSREEKQVWKILL